MSEDIIPQPFTSLQVELLKLYAMKVSENDLLQIKQLLGQFFAEKASNLADEIWDAKNLTEEQILAQHHRTPYPPKSK